MTCNIYNYKENQLLCIPHYFLFKCVAHNQTIHIDYFLLANSVCPIHCLYTDSTAITDSSTIILAT